jgi:hypothetical protein
MKGFFRTHPSPCGRVLLIESGPRSISEPLLSDLYRDYECSVLDLLTCYAGAPATFDPARGRIIRVNVPEVQTRRSSFVRWLSAQPYELVVLLSTGDGTLRKWKYVIALLTRARVALVDEESNALAFLHWREALRPRRLGFRRRHLAVFRVGAETLVFPFVLLFLTLSAGRLHAQRAWRMWRTPKSSSNLRVGADERT